ncbi:MAG: RNA polymerase-associated protein RapA [Halieaceae bacterium]|nr:RNA polymerase-associated protein RapA [Halieaceae bacterium]
MSFAIGQRWLSHADSELGLGIVVDHDPRRVTLHFPAVGEDRTYAVANAPLTRLRLRPGDRLTTRDGQTHAVAIVHEQESLLVYEVGGDGTRVIELDLDDRIDLSTPRQRLLASQFDSSAAFALRVATCEHLDRLERSGLRGLLGTRTALLPHQLYIASEVGRRHAPRVLLADEVGLGKTIEAGMILHRQLLTGAARRALIVVPDSLQFQWLVEMRRRFNLNFALFDAERVAESDGNAFEEEQLVLAPSGLFADREACRRALEAAWDIVVVDEAHRIPLRDEATAEAATHSDVLPGFLEALAQCSAGLLLLTATPERVGQRAHFARLALLDPERFHDFERFQQEEGTYAHWSALIEALERGEIPDDLPADINASDADGRIAALIDRYGTGRVLFRNSRAAVGGFPRRHLEAHALPAPTDPAFLGLFPDQGMDPGEWLEKDPRVAWLISHLRKLRPAKVLVICAQATTAQVLEEYLQLRAGIRAAAFHEGLNLVERDRAAAYFAEPDQGAQALICSEIGGEGRNFQFAQHLVLFDLPRHPDQLEQRIGRLDRIGQAREIHLHVPHIRGSAQETLLRWYNEGMGLFEHSCSAGDMILNRFEARLKEQLTKRDEAFDELLADTAEFTRQTRLELSEGRDRLLERSSCHAPTGQAIARDIADIENPQRLYRYLEDLCDVAGVEHDDHSEYAAILRHGEQEVLSVFPELPEDGCTVTVDRDRALKREDFVFLGWEHPWMEGAMESVLGSALGQASVASLSLRGVPTGSRLYEFLFVVRVSAPRELGVNRYLSLHPLRLLVDARGKQLGEVLSHAALNDRVESLPRSTASKVVKQLREEIEQRCDDAEALAQRHLEDRRLDAIAAYRSHLEGELERLEALRRYNPLIREDEIEMLRLRLAQGQEALAAAQISLQGLRLVLIR